MAFATEFSEAKTLLESSDAVLVSYPVYTFFVPYKKLFARMDKENRRA